MKRAKLLLLMSVLAGTLIPASCTRDYDNDPEGLIANEESINDYDEDEILADFSDNHVTIDEAEHRLANLLQSFDDFGDRIQRHINDRLVSKPFKTLKKSSSSDEPMPFYVFNFADSAGFAIMSSDRRIESLLVLAESGNIDETLESDNPVFQIFKSRLEGYCDSVINADTTEKILSKSVTYNGNDVTWTSISYKNKIFYPNGLCKVHWNQQKPSFNKIIAQNLKLPTDSILSGCGPIAVAQLMSCYKHPKSYMGYKYDWDSIIRGKYKYNEEVAYLLWHLWDKSNLNVTRTSSGSSCNPNNIPRTLKNFGYSDGGKKIVYKTGNVISELKEGHPVIVFGYDNKDATTKVISGGHGWLVHGLMSRDEYMKTYTNGIWKKTEYISSSWYVLCNCGWRNTSCNGYYLSEVFDFSSQKAPYSENLSKSNKNNYYQYNVSLITNIRK